MPTHGFKISEPGYDVKTAPDANLSVKPDFTLLKVAEYGSFDISSMSLPVTITHNLGYVPQFLGYAFDDTQGNINYIRTTKSSYDFTGLIIDANTSDINIWASSAFTIVNYFVFYEQA